MAFIKVVNTNTVDGILADFQTKVEQLNALADRKQKAIDERIAKITELALLNDADRTEAVKAEAAASKINSLFN